MSDYGKGAIIDPFVYGQAMTQIEPYLKPGLCVIDYGCGNGELAQWMADAGCFVMGVEKTYTRQFGQKSCLPPLESGTWDLVICNNVLEHIEDDIGTLSKFAQMLCAGGRLILDVPTIYSSVYRLGLAREHDKRVGHLRRYSKAQIIGLVKAAGFEIERVVWLDSALRDWLIIGPLVIRPLKWLARPFKHPRVRGWFNRLDARLAPYLFPAAIYVHARKGSEVRDDKA